MDLRLAPAVPLGDIATEASPTERPLHLLSLVSDLHKVAEDRAGPLATIAYKGYQKMPSTLRFCLVLHNHQPIGNFDDVFERAYRDSYLPFLEVFEPYVDLSITLHTSGPLMEWLAGHYPEYLDRLATLVSQQRIEILGGAFYEAILTMIPPRDRIGQITSFRDWLDQHLGAKVRGMWMPERVWEQSLTQDLVQAGIDYTVLDDFHFSGAGTTRDPLHGYFLTEDNGSVLNLFPGSERLRYLIPFGEPGQTIEHLRMIAEQDPDTVVVFGDDGEKFGTWPDTKEHVYDRGWLRQFFDILSEQAGWLKTTTLADAIDHTPPQGTLYLPDASYREMTEWALPVERQQHLETLTDAFQDDSNWQRLKSFVRGGTWRNFKVKYPEANEMYARMMAISQRVEQAEEQGVAGTPLSAARKALYRAQCNCSYWHGAFGGIYLPHLRNAVYQNLIDADRILDEALGKAGPFIEVSVDDYNFDARPEIRLGNEQLTCFLAPAAGGILYELDVRAISHNLLATLARRPEAYHPLIMQGENSAQEEVASIHQRIVFKQKGLEQRLQYDARSRKSLIDHFLDNDTTLSEIARGDQSEHGNFSSSPFMSRIRRNSDRVQVQLWKEGTAFGVPLKLTKGVTLSAGSPTIEIAYLLEGLPVDHPLHFAVEFNFAGLPAGNDDRYFHQEDRRLGPLETLLDLKNIQEVGMIDEWLGIDVRWSANRPTHLWAHPVETVSQSESGFELVHQSVALLPHWLVQGDDDGRWSVAMEVTLDVDPVSFTRTVAAELASH